MRMVIGIIVLYGGSLVMNMLLEDGNANLVESMILLLLTIIYIRGNKKK